MFNTYDDQGQRTRGLEPNAVARLLRVSMPQLTDANIRYVLAHLGMMDTTSDGFMTFEDLMHMLRATEVTSPAGLHIKGFRNYRSPANHVPLPAQPKPPVTWSEPAAALAHDGGYGARHAPAVAPLQQSSQGVARRDIGLQRLPRSSGTT